MARKVFISVLGSTNYGTCKYEFKEKNCLSGELRFIQEATLQMLDAASWNSESVGFICVTEGDRGSYNLNWKDNGHKDRTSGCYIHCEGLETRISKLSLPFSVKPVQIKDGNSKEEIWEVFDTVFKLLKDEDEIYFDITHGFRYLPMLILVLSNYAKFLKNIKVKSITYGNFEARNNGIAPIIDITSFSVLQDWTSATQTFLETGQTANIVNLVTKYDLNALKNFATEIFEVRGRNIYSGLSAIEAKKELQNVELKEPPFNNLKNKLINLFDSFKLNSVDNIYSAVKYCDEFGLIQQGFTLFIEFIISKVILDCEVINSDEDLYDIELRSVVSSALSLKNVDKFDFNRFSAEQKEEYTIIVQKIFELSYKKNLTGKIYNSLSSGGRNDLNHGGFRPISETKDTGYFKNKLKEYINRYEKLNINTPCS
ncbi:MAG: TIGR02221 family CRISPR-associated protein [Bacteroidales bacterium]|nr:TIGR02221 family CRISPR-associated protein [Bacteroidales bacterium]